MLCRYNLALKWMQVVYKPQCISQCMKSSFGCSINTSPWSRSQSSNTSNIDNLSLSPGCHVRDNSLNQPYGTYFKDIINERNKSYYSLIEPTAWGFIVLRMLSKRTKNQEILQEENRRTYQLCCESGKNR